MSARVGRAKMSFSAACCALFMANETGPFWFRRTGNMIAHSAIMRPGSSPPETGETRTALHYRLAGGPGGRCRLLRASEVCRGRKVRTPQGSVPDNVRDVGLKTHGRPVPQKRYRLGYPSLSSDAGGHPEGPLRFAWTASPAGVRVKWCGKSAPLRR